MTNKARLVNAGQGWWRGRAGHYLFRTAALGLDGGWGWCAVTTNWKLVLEAGESSRWRESTQHRGEEEGVGGYRVPIEVPAPRCWAGTAIAGHAKRPQSEAQANSMAGGCEGLHAVSLPRGMGPGPRGGLGGRPTPTPFCPWSCKSQISQLQSSGSPSLARVGARWIGGMSQESVLWLSSPGS